MGRSGDPLEVEVKQGKSQLARPKSLSRGWLGQLQGSVVPWLCLHRLWWADIALGVFGRLKAWQVKGCL